jgi:hypothetical protein
MDAIRFDNLSRSLERHTPRRGALGLLGGGGLTALLTRAGFLRAAHLTTAAVWEAAACSL